MTPLVDWIYLSLALILAVIFAMRANRKLLMAIFLGWLLGYPALIQEEIVPHIASMDFDLQPTRIMLLLLIPLLFFYCLHARRLRGRALAPINRIEWWLIAYLFFSILSLILNSSALGSRLVISGIEKQLVFGLLYVLGRDFLTERDYKVLTTALVVFAVFSALVGIGQNIASPDFFRVGTYRAAYADVSRSTGAFGQEYEQGMFLTFVIAIVLLSRKTIRVSEVLLTVLFAGAVLVTFQRMPWIVFFLTIGVALYVRTFRQSGVRRLTIVGGSLMLITLLWVPWQRILPEILNSNLIYGRILDDTLSIRFALNNFALSLLPRYPLGLGFTTASPVYNQEYFSAGVPGFHVNSWTGLVVHNGYLSALVRFGIGGGLGFCGMLISNFLVFLKRYTCTERALLIPVFLCGIFMFYNLTQDFAFAESEVVLIFALLLGYFSHSVWHRAPTQFTFSTEHLALSPKIS